MHGKAFPRLHGGWFGGNGNAAPPAPRDSTVLETDAEMQVYVSALERNGFRGTSRGPTLHRAQPPQHQDERTMHNCSSMRSNFMIGAHVICHAGPNAYYMNHAANTQYANKALHAGVLYMPALYIGATYVNTMPSSLVLAVVFAVCLSVNLCHSLSLSVTLCVNLCHFRSLVYLFAPFGLPAVFISCTHCVFNTALTVTTRNALP